MSSEIAGPFAPPTHDATPVPVVPVSTAADPVVAYLQATVGPKLAAGAILVVYGSVMLAGEIGREHELPGQALLTLGLYSLVGLSGVFAMASGAAAVRSEGVPWRARWALTAELRFWQLLGSFVLLLIVIAIHRTMVPG